MSNATGQIDSHTKPTTDSSFTTGHQGPFYTQRRLRSFRPVITVPRRGKRSRTITAKGSKIWLLSDYPLGILEYILCVLQRFAVMTLGSQWSSMPSSFRQHVFPVAGWFALGRWEQTSMAYLQWSWSQSRLSQEGKPDGERRSACC